MFNWTSKCERWIVQQKFKRFFLFCVIEAKGEVLDRDRWNICCVTSYLKKNSIFVLLSMENRYFTFFTKSMCTLQFNSSVIVIRSRIIELVTYFNQMLLAQFTGNAQTLQTVQRNHPLMLLCWTNVIKKVLLRSSNFWGTWL